LFANEQPKSEFLTISNNLQADEQNLIKPNISDQPKEIENLTKLDIWETEFSELENYFNSITLPDEPIFLNSCTKIDNISLFVSSHLALIKNYGNNKISIPCINRLQECKKILETNMNIKR